MPRPKHVQGWCLTSCSKLSSKIKHLKTCRLPTKNKAMLDTALHTVHTHPNELNLYPPHWVFPPHNKHVLSILELHLHPAISVFGTCEAPSHVPQSSASQSPGCVTQRDSGPGQPLWARRRGRPSWAAAMASGAWQLPPTKRWVGNTGASNGDSLAHSVATRLRHTSKSSDHCNTALLWCWSK